MLKTIPRLHLAFIRSPTLSDTGGNEKSQPRRGVNHVDTNANFAWIGKPTLANDYRSLSCYEDPYRQQTLGFGPQPVSWNAFAQ